LKVVAFVIWQNGAVLLAFNMKWQFCKSFQISIAVIFIRTHSMNLKLATFLASAALCFSLFATNSPAFANHGWEIQGLVCSGGTLYMTIYEEPKTGTTVVPSIDVNGVPYKIIGDLDTHNVNIGVHVYAYSDHAFSIGTTVRVYNTKGEDAGGPSSQTAVCGGDRGPLVPAGFSLHYITCDVAIFASPDLNYPTLSKIIKNQRWYVKDTTIKGTDGKDWNEVFAASYENGYIPNYCIGPLWYLSDGK
jgi:hypothetical protein